VVLDPPVGSLDHVSLVTAPGAVTARGFRLTPTAGAAGHGRVLLDRSYLEIRTAAGAGTTLRASSWFLRCDDLEAAAARLRTGGFEVGGPQRYEGHDGTWLDLVLGSRAETHLPTLTTRVDVPAGSWPPAFERPHPNGATRLVEVRVRVSEPEPLAAALLALGATSVDRRRFLLGDGGAAVLATEPGPPAVVSLTLERREGVPLVLDLDD